MDGKPDAEDLVMKALKDPELLKSLAAAPAPADGDAEEAKEE
jgi:type VI secretion system protein ImpB